MKILNEFIAEIKKFGQKKVAGITGISVRTINNWCRGKAVPTMIKAQTVANAMGLEFLLFDKENDNE